MPPVRCEPTTRQDGRAQVRRQSYASQSWRWRRNTAVWALSAPEALPGTRRHCAPARTDCSSKAFIAFPLRFCRSVPPVTPYAASLSCKLRSLKSKRLVAVVIIDKLCNPFPQRTVCVKCLTRRAAADSWRDVLYRIRWCGVHGHDGTWHSRSPCKARAICALYAVKH